MKEMVLKVVGDNKMHCGGCESAVKFMLLALPGVQDVQASHQNQCIAIRYDDTQHLGRDQVVEELGQLGYQVEEIQP